MTGASRKIAVLLVEDSEKWTGVVEELWKESLGKPGDEWSFFKCFNHEYPTPEQANGFNAIIIGGSRHSCTDPTDWIVKLREELVPAYAKSSAKLIGCCFGSQMVAKALGGHVGQNPSGRFILYSETIKVQDTLKKYPHMWDALSAKAALPDGVMHLWEAHGEQVLELPPGGETLASSDNTKNELWHVGSNVLAFQFHPEFNGAVMYDKIWPRLTEIGRLSADESAESKESLLNSPVDSFAARDMINAFIEKGVISA